MGQRPLDQRLVAARDNKGKGYGVIRVSGTTPLTPGPPPCPLSLTNTSTCGHSRSCITEFAKSHPHYIASANPDSCNPSLGREVGLCTSSIPTWSQSCVAPVQSWIGSRMCRRNRSSCLPLRLERYRQGSRSPVRRMGLRRTNWKSGWTRSLLPTAYYRKSSRIQARNHRCYSSIRTSPGLPRRGEAL